MNSRSFFVIVSLLVPGVVALADSAEAGRFQVREVSYSKSSGVYTGQVRVQVRGVIYYRGREDLNHDNWLIQSFLNDSKRSVSLTDWSSPDEWGHGYNGSRPPKNGELILCTPENLCAAEAQVDTCGFRDENVEYVGRVAASVYGDETAHGEKIGRVAETQCLYSIGGKVVNLDRKANVVLRNDVTAEFVTVQGAGRSDSDRPTEADFEFAKKVRDGAEYDVRVVRQPANGQVCRVDSWTASGHVTARDVTDIKVNCTDYCRATADFNVVPPPGDFSAAEAVGCGPASLEYIGDEVVADYSNNLLWTLDLVQNSSGEYVFGENDDLEQACRNLVLAGREDWRLPDIAQLQTLLPDCYGVLHNCWGDTWHQLQSGEYCRPDVLLSRINLSSTVSSDSGCTLGDKYSCVWGVQFEPVCEAVRAETQILSIRSSIRGYGRCVTPLD